MYSYEERMRAVKLFIQYDHSFTSIKRELVYPNSRVEINCSADFSYFFALVIPPTFCSLTNVTPPTFVLVFEPPAL